MKQRRLRRIASAGGFFSAAACPMIAFADREISRRRFYSLRRHHNGCIGLLHLLSNEFKVGNERRRAKRKYARKNKSAYTNLPVATWSAVNHCRGGDVGMSSSTKHAMHSNLHDSNEDFSEHRKEAIVNAYDEIETSHLLINTSAKTNQKEPSTRESIVNDASQHENEKHQQPQPYHPTTKVIIEFDTQAVGGVERGKSIRNRIRSRIESENEWNRVPNRGPSASLSISLDASPSSSATLQNADDYGYAVPSRYTLEHAGATGNNDQTLLNNLLVPTRTAIALVAQTASLLPALLLSRRVLNLTWTAVVDYIRGRIFRTTFTQLERAYLKYYEFPAITRATARLVSQIGILLGLSWAVRWWMILISMGNKGVGPMVLGVAGIDDIGMVGTGSEREGALLGRGWKVGLPCHLRGKGIAWLCGFIWIGAVVGIGHILAMALSVWGGPLRLQAAAQQSENPTNALRRIIHHPIIWIRGLEEWKHIPSLGKFRQRNRTGKSRHGERVFDPDPLLFPATWLPLRWLQIFAVAKAFSTDPLRYRWCSPEDDKIMIPRLMKQYLVQLALGDEWRRVFLGEKRVGLGIVVVLSYFIALVWMVITAFKLDGGASAMLIPSVVAAAISALMNITIFWNRLPSREQRKALNAMGLA
eukprot:CAMPEP_0172567728 /NCGR_PEP_ID=MMETSP1067-20121228/116932_1 /TAXON_ID=265564 ORGANISM="Thalassiosira punctigera, Strain Tpunct2005C2" /NCGR_SAMPLE_ID=MMETSP1067 /ASSEMBLY_ACC=CAM_ASM_000444 /LENGTH=644 /DNA_ID=CAMNT_0013359143 /DNA_START=170 /DNA_END=2104 /DNA_ORIENTATION=+